MALLQFLPASTTASLVLEVRVNPLVIRWVWASFLLSPIIARIPHCRAILQGLHHGMALSVTILICAISLLAIWRVYALVLQSWTLPSSALMVFSRSGQSHLEWTCLRT